VTGEPLPDLSALRPAVVVDVDKAVARATLLAVIRAGMAAHPRGLQVQLGPSEIGTACDRRLGFALANRPEVNHSCDWKATLGVAGHDWLAKVFAALGGGEYLVEAKVRAGILNGEDLDGHCDLLWLLMMLPIDWKIVGPSRLDSYRRKGPLVDYLVQVNTYGLGWELRGLVPQAVGIMFLPRNGDLEQAHLWVGDYEPAKADHAIARAEGIATAGRAIGWDALLPMLPIPTGATAFDDVLCSWCPWWRPNTADLSRACPGADRHGHDEAVRVRAGKGIISPARAS
jgi:hypothetical protein